MCVTVLLNNDHRLLGYFFKLLLCIRRNYTIPKFSSQLSTQSASISLFSLVLPAFSFSSHFIIDILTIFPRRYHRLPSSIQHMPYETVVFFLYVFSFLCVLYVFVVVVCAFFYIFAQRILSQFYVWFGLFNLCIC